MKRSLLVAITAAIVLHQSAAPRAVVVTPEALTFFKNYFVTGDYVVGGVGLRGRGVSGLALGSIQVSGVPEVDGHPTADILAAFLYWQVVSTDTLGPDSGSVGVTFRGSPLSSVDGPFGKALSTVGTAPCWASGGSAGSSGGSKRTYTYRADVLRYFDLDPLSGKPVVNGAHQVQVPDSGSNGNGVPLALGASLVVVYRDPAKPFSAIVLYDGGFTLDNSTRTMNQTIKGFYQSADGPDRPDGTGKLGVEGKLTHIVGSGQANKSETLWFNDVPLGSPFTASAGPSWDNPTFPVWVPPASAQVTTSVNPSNDCLTWGATVFRTEVQDTDQDGLLDIWESSATPILDPLGQPLPNLKAMGADPFVKDLFVEIGYMKADAETLYGDVRKPAHKHLPPPSALKLMGDAFRHAPVPNPDDPEGATGINVHFDVGDPVAYHLMPGYSSREADPYIIGTTTAAAGLARGGEAINEIRMPGDTEHPTAETAQECIRGAGDPPWRCQFSDYPGTVGWKTGFRFFRDQVIGGEPAPAADAEDPCDAPGNDGPGQSCERRFDRNRKAMFHYALFAHAVGLSKSELPCLSSTGPDAIPVEDVGGSCAVAENPLFRTPRTITGVGDFPGGDVLVTLGAFADTDGLPVGTPIMQASTLMHELGHNFERRHGGEALEPNCKPTYLSVMNYLYQLRGLLDDAGRPNLDFSRGIIEPALGEASLSDGSLGTLPYRIGWYAPLVGSYLDPMLGGLGTAARTHCDGSSLLRDASGILIEPAMVRVDARTRETGTIPIDWDADATIDPSYPGPGLDINFNGSPDLLRGSDDWSNIRLNQIGVRRSVGGLFLDENGALALGPLSLDAGRSDYGRSDYGRSDYGRSDYGRSDYGSGLGRSDYGRSDYGRSDYGRSDYGRSDYGRGDDGRGDVGGGDLFVGDPSSPGGELDAETATDLAKTPPNEFRVCVIGVDVDCLDASASSGVVIGWKAPNIGGVTGYLAYRVPGGALVPGQTWEPVVGDIVEVEPGNYRLIDDGRLSYAAQYTYFAVAVYPPEPDQPETVITSDPSNLITITTPKASSTVSVTCPASVAYTGAPQTPCTATYATADGLSGSLTVSYTTNTNAGQASASANYAGDDSHAGSTGTGAFTIVQASSTTTVTCPASVPYTGSPQTPCTARYATTDGLSGPLTVSYTTNTNAGGAGASASYAGDANHAGSTGTGSFTITRATPAFSGLSGPTVNIGAAPVVLGGTLKAGSLVPSGSVSITLNAVTQMAAIDPATGAFSSSFATTALTQAGSPYAITYSYAGDANFAAAGDTSMKLTVVLPYTLVNVKNLPPAPGVTFKPSPRGTLVDFEWKFSKGGVVVSSADSMPSVTITSPSGISTTYTPANCAFAGIKFVYRWNAKMWDFHWVVKNAAVGTHYVTVSSGKTGQRFPAAGPGFPVVFRY